LTESDYSYYRPFVPNPNQTKGSLSRLKRRLQKAGIRQQDIAAEAGVSNVHVCNVLADRDQSQKVIETAKRMLKEAGARSSNGNAAS